MLKVDWRMKGHLSDDMNVKENDKGIHMEFNYMVTTGAHYPIQTQTALTSHYCVE